MIFDRWQAPDRDSPTTVGFEFKVEIGTQLDAIMRAEGKRGTLDGVVKTSSGDNLSRPRRWHKMFERMGLLYPDSDGNTQLTDLGLTIRSAQKNAAKEYRRLLAKQAISVLRKYQLRNPADILDGGRYPDHCDIHPYWALWKAAIELDGKLHWDELNRELMWVLKHSDLDAAISKIRRARLEPGYDPVTGGGPVTRLRERAYDQSSAPDDRDPSGQVRDQKTTPWFKRAGLGELLMVMPGRTGGGYWKIHDDIIDLLAQEVKSAPVYNAFETDQEWFSYFGTAESLNSSYESETHEPTVIESCKHLYELVLERHNVVFYGPPGTGKTHASLNLASEWERINGAGSVFKVTFHPSYGYEDFVQGYRPKSDNPSLFSLKNGIFLVAADQARKIEIENKKVLLVIDEINRG
ncbi:AAA family ATPase, partial [Pseudomonas sp. KCJK9000]